MPCDRCGQLMRPLSGSRGRVLVYWCSLCGRFAEVARA